MRHNDRRVQNGTPPWSACRYARLRRCASDEQDLATHESRNPRPRRSHALSARNIRCCCLSCNRLRWRRRWLTHLTDEWRSGSSCREVSVSAFTVTPSIVGSGRSYLVSFTMTETSGRAGVTVTTIRFGLGSAASANADPSPPLRLVAGGSASSGNINLNDLSGATSSITAISVTG